MIENATGIILRTRPLLETSLIVCWLTPEAGRIATAAKGARRPKSPFAGKLDLFYLADFSFSRSRRSDLHVLREVSLRETNAALRGDILSLRRASYAAAFVEQVTETDTPLPGVFRLLHGFLDNLCRKPAAAPFLFAFELKMLQELGLDPDVRKADLSPGAREISRALLNGGWQTLSRLKLTRPQASELRQFLHGFLIFHLGRLPEGRAAALADEA